MGRNITVTFADGSQHVYENAPDEVTPEQVSQRANQEFGKDVKSLDGGRGQRASTTGPDGQAVEFDVPEGSDDATVRGLASKATNDPRYAESEVQRPALSDVLSDSAKYVGGNIAKGAMSLADLMATGGETATNAIGDVIASGGDALLRAHGFDDAASSFSDFFSRDFHSPTFAERMDEQIPQEGAPGVGFASQMLGGALVPFGPKAPPKPQSLSAMIPRQAEAPSAARELVDAGKQANVRIMTSDVRPPKTFIGKTAQSLGEKVPIAGTGGPRAVQQEQRIEAVRQVARDYGAVTGDDMAAPAVDDVMADFAKTRGAVIEHFAKTKKAVIEGTQGEVPVPNTIRALDAKIAEFTKVGTPAANALVGKLEGWKQALLIPGRTEQTGILDAAGKPITRTIAPQGKSLSTIDKIRAEMGEAFKDPSLASIKAAGEKALQSIYGPMKSDMGAFIKTSAGPEKFAQWQKSNRVLSEMADELRVSSVKSVLRSGQGSPEDIAKILFSQKPSDVSRLYRSLSEQGRQRAQTAILQRVLEKSGGVENASPAKFVTQVHNLSRPIGVFFKGPDLARIEGLSRVLDATRRAADANFSPPTGAQNVPYAMGAGFTGLFGLFGGTAAAGAAGLFARAYESAPVRDALLRLGKTPKGTKAEAIAMDRAASAISAAVANHTAALNDNVPVSAAARQPDEQRNQQEPVPQP